MVHLPHVPNRQNAQQHGVKEHHDAPAETLLNGIQVVGEQAHQVAHLVDLVVLPAQIFGTVKHVVPQFFFQPNRRTQEAKPPHKTAHHHGQNHRHHGHTNVIQQEVQVKGHADTVDIHHTVVHAVDEHTVQLRDLQLQEIHHAQCNQAKHQNRRKLQIIPVYMLTEYHDQVFLSFLYKITKVL